VLGGSCSLSTGITFVGLFDFASVINRMLDKQIYELHSTGVRIVLLSNMTGWHGDLAGVLRDLLCETGQSPAWIVRERLLTG
jgi:hypothetical protein